MLPVALFRSLVGRAWLSTLLCVALGLLGCDERRSTPELLELTDVTPRVLRSGDEVLVTGRDLPVGQVDEAKVLLIGRTSRPGQPSDDVRTVEIPGARVAREGVSFHVDDVLLSRFCGDGELAEHATFTGRVEVWLPSSGRLPVFGSLKSEIVIDFTPRRPTSKVAGEREVAVREIEEQLGATFGPTDQDELSVASLVAGGALARAGASAGDVVTALDDVTVIERQDLRLRADGKPAKFELRRGDEPVLALVPTDAFQSQLSSNASLGAILALGVFGAVLVFFGPWAFWLRWLAFRLREAIARAREGGALERTLFAAAGQGRSRSVGSSVGALALVLGLVVCFGTFPLVELRFGLGLEIVLVYLIGLSARSTAALLGGGWGRGGFLAKRARALLWTAVSELPAALALALVIATTGAASIRDLVEVQSGLGPEPWNTGSMPWHWLAFRSPMTAALFATFFFAALIERDGRANEGRGLFASLGITDWIHLLLASGLAVTLFLGGYGVPFVTRGELVASSSMQLVGACVFLVKALFVALAVLLVRSALPRFTPDVFRQWGLRVALPLGVVATAIAVATSVHPPLPSIEKTLATSSLVVTASVALGLLIAVFARSARRADVRDRVKVNPFL
jgi:NADH:ubiquinone oxidoreductase subunit H